MGVGYTDPRKLTYVMKVYGANATSVEVWEQSTFQKKVLDNTSTSPVE